MTSLSPAEQLLQELGITEPNEIDVEVIAWSVGARVRYRPLPRGDARIVGMGDRAIITVDDRASRVRQRFSVAHELGHWHHHRGQRLICHDASGNAPDDTCEREADRYAAELLMPRFMLVPWMAKAPISIALADGVARLFHVSTLAAALRLADVHAGHFALIVDEPDGRRWFKRSPALAGGWYLRLDVSTGEKGSKPASQPKQWSVPAQRHFRGRNLSGIWLRCETAHAASGQRLTLITAPV
ncbi:ImmA/IrrE family metallo-endopeptidase [uncultured Sphingomonas sp.]|uniref:ImmA/IrrE family metallo-endopeptidase n=1 Tax=uncultured Sphingomonas sp. TaxID=158754 RepID=UPI00260C401D|nr:ImmA/IrrE family metallo-endopeptidase [uncultured Sphingomonas sp.]